MAVEELSAQLAKETSRRTVVKTGAKLAYAAPIVAASFKLSARGAGAATVSGEPGSGCSGDFVCGNAPTACGTDNRGFGDTCYCFASTENTGVCGANICITPSGTCASSDQCPDGSFCSVNTCCGDGACIPRCGDVSGDSFDSVGAGNPAGI
jgi:hypothetical protein